jgi:hypothetical protein
MVFTSSSLSPLNEDPQIPTHSIKSRALQRVSAYKLGRDLNHQPPSSQPHPLPHSLVMPKRKTTSSPTQPSLSQFLQIRKQSHLPVSKKTKIEETGSPAQPCESTVCPSTLSVSDLITILDLIDEVILFAGKPLLWNQIQEEIYSLHKRYFPQELS